MIYLLTAKNILLSQFYESYKKITIYLNRKVPVGIGIFITVLFQISGSILLTLLGVECSKFIPGELIYLYFAFLAWVHSFMQAKKDYDTFSARYQRTIFVFGYNNKKAVLSGSLAYWLLDTVINPLVYIPYCVFPIYYFRNTIFTLANVSIPLCLYFYTFLKQEKNRNKSLNGQIIEITYWVKTVLISILFAYILFQVLDGHNISLDYVENVSKQIEGNINSILNKILFWIPIVFSLTLLLSCTILYFRIRTFRCVYYSTTVLTKECRWVKWLSKHCRDVKVKSDLAIIARRRDLWSESANSAFIFPNTVLISMILIFYTHTTATTPVNMFLFMLTILILELVTVSNFIFNNMSFMLFHNAEMKNIDLYIMTGRDRAWLLIKKVKLLSIIMIPAAVVLNISLICMGLLFTKSFLYLLFPVFTLLSVVLISFIQLYWMHFYHHRYSIYEEFLTYKINYSMKRQWSSIPLFLLCLPCFLYLFVIFGKEIYIPDKLIFWIMILILFGTLTVALFVSQVSLIKWKNH